MCVCVWSTTARSTTAKSPAQKCVLRGCMRTFRSSGGIQYELPVVPYSDTKKKIVFLLKSQILK